MDLTIEQLGEVEVTSVSRRVETLHEAPAAVYVITREQIRRSGVTSIPEALRLAPGVEVARNGTHDWTISIRGFNDDLSNKLLVLIDGRSVYSPLFAGVFWDVQDTLLEDVERIEVIAGPGGTLWGANAVNGVVNIITRSAWDTRDGYASLAAGNEEELTAALRYGGRIGRDIAARAYLKRVERDDSRARSGGPALDAWKSTQGGFRLDWTLADRDTLTLQGDVYDAEGESWVRSEFTLGELPEGEVPGMIDLAGYNLLARWQRQLEHGADLRVQAYFDRTERDIPGNFAEERETFDLELVHHARPIGRHDLVWGAGYRVTADELDNTQFATFRPSERTDETWNLFAQDRIELMEDRLYLTLGTRFEHNEYSGFEHKPSARLAWMPAPRQTLWAAVSRAVRIPARLNHDLDLHAPLRLPGLPVPLYVNVTGNDDFDPEELIAYEIGYRAGIAENLSADLALFVHDYESLMTQEVQGPPRLEPGPPPYLILPVVQDNGMKGQSYGGQLAVKWQPLDLWRLELQLAHVDFDLELTEGSTGSGALAVAGHSPELQAALQSYFDLPRGFELYAAVRYVDELPAQDVPSYVAVDLNLDWQLTADVSASLTVQNLNDPHHPEFGDGNLIQRSVLLRLDWRF
ncbi:MAG TPA: TonB-dependent receptor [Pseudomonadales bacterium]